jgi:lipopolysaccharide biosynthesis glycosyltransferase
MDDCFCTIITPDYLHYALAVRASLLKFNSNFHFHILVSGRKEGLKQATEQQFDQTFVTFADEICTAGRGKALYDKYYHHYMDGFRWSMKPVFINHLFEKGAYKKVIYLDSDIHFFQDFRFLFDALDDNRVLLSPHFRSSDPFNDSLNFTKNFTEGIYNGGFIAASDKGKEVMDWWADACLYNCVIDTKNGFFVDQKYLDMAPSVFDGVVSLRHEGCNIAEWNCSRCRRSVSNGSVMINDKFPIVFIHFTHYTILNIIQKKDPLLDQHLKTYSATIRRFNPQFDLYDSYRKLADAPPSKGGAGRMEKMISGHYVKRLTTKINAALKSFADS